MTHKSFKSKIGIVLSGTYLFVSCVLGFGGALSEANAIGFLSLLILLTAPWSFVSRVFCEGGRDCFHNVFWWIVAAGVLLNALILYVLGLLFTKLIKFFRGHSKDNRREIIVKDAK
ncbi:MAG: hypothetical protein IPL32_09465 [Chloracidobacterium sp.]|nr:hypothetical protein [Chloracidobacterium sp.]